AREATVAAPVGWMTVSGVADADTFGDGALPAEIPGPGPFDPKVVPVRIASFGCRIPLAAQTSVQGVRDVIVDVDVPKDGTVGVGLRAAGAAVMRIGGKVALERQYAAGGGYVSRFATVDTTQGVLRLVVRVGMDMDYSSVEIGAWDSSGKPLRAHA